MNVGESWDVDGTHARQPLLTSVDTNNTSDKMKAHYSKSLVGQGGLGGGGSNKTNR